MTQIKNIGRYCVTDSDGYIVNDTSIKKIQPEYMEVINEVVERYQLHLGDHLHSVYVRGSVSRGLGIAGVSDLDTIGVTTVHPEALDLQWVKAAEQEINRKYSCINGIEFSFHHKQEVLETSDFSIIPFMIKTHSICFYGEDLTPYLPDYKADAALGNEHLVHLKYQIEQAKEDLTDNEDTEDIQDCCSWIMKIIVRAGIALVITKEHLYTRDLYPAYQLFAKHFPEKSFEMREALQFAIAPSENPNDICNILNTFGNWMINESETWLQNHNPDKVIAMKL